MYSCRDNKKKKKRKIELPYSLDDDIIVDTGIADLDSHFKINRRPNRAF
jgi:hypothetical protein